MTEYDAIVYDLDGTLVHLDVDWETCEQTLRDHFEEASIGMLDGDAWEILAAAEAINRGDEAAEIIARYERDGATRASRLPTAAEVSEQSVPVGVCSLNCEAACREALSQVDLEEGVSVVIGRDSHETRKPDPGPLLAAVDALGATPDRTLFVGDSPSDRTTAERAGTAFRPVPNERTNR